MDQGGGLLHVLLHLVLLVLDDALLGASAATPAAAGRCLRLRLAQRKLGQLAIGAVVDALLLARLLLPFEADDGGLDPLVLTQALLALRQVLLQGGDDLIGRRGRLGPQGDASAADMTRATAIAEAAIVRFTLHKRSMLSWWTTGTVFRLKAEATKESISLGEAWLPASALQRLGELAVACEAAAEAA